MVFWKQTDASVYSSFRTESGKSHYVKLAQALILALCIYNQSNNIFLVNNFIENPDQSHRSRNKKHGISGS